MEKTAAFRSPRSATLFSSNDLLTEKPFFPKALDRKADHATTMTTRGKQGFEQLEAFARKNIFHKLELLASTPVQETEKAGIPQFWPAVYAGHDEKISSAIRASTELVAAIEKLPVTVQDFTATILLRLITIASLHFLRSPEQQVLLQEHGLKTDTFKDAEKEFLKQVKALRSLPEERGVHAYLPNDLDALIKQHQSRDPLLGDEEERIVQYYLYKDIEELLEILEEFLAKYDYVLAEEKEEKEGDSHEIDAEETGGDEETELDQENDQGQEAPEENENSNEDENDEASELTVDEENGDDNEMAAEAENAEDSDELDTQEEDGENDNELDEDEEDDNEDEEDEELDGDETEEEENELAEEAAGDFADDEVEIADGYESDEVDSSNQEDEDGLSNDIVETSEIFAEEDNSEKEETNTQSGEGDPEVDAHPSEAEIFSKKPNIGFFKNPVAAIEHKEVLTTFHATPIYTM